jgi:hypothetical protein
LHCSFVCGDLAIPQTLVSPGCLHVPVDLTQFPDPGPLRMMAAQQQADCKNVMWTAGCTFAAQQQAAVGCKDVMWTAGCTFGGAQQAAADCKDVMWTAGCTFAGAQQAGAGCKDVMWTAGCTFAGAQAQLPQTLLPPCNNPTLATHCFICPPPNPCRPILGTRLCTLTGPLTDLVNARSDQDCKNVMWTAGCTFAGQQVAGAGAECGKVLTTLACTLGGAKGDDCGSVLTTLVCTLAKPSPNDSPMCITLLTHVPTWCQPDTGGDVGCKHVLWTAGCTFAGQQGAPECGNVLTTLVCTLAKTGADDAEQCGNVLTTLACTLSADKLPGAEGAADCKHVLWTAGCTFQGLAKGERCGDVLTTLACTLAAAPVEGQANQADCKDVLWTAGCTFAVTPSDRGDGCKVVAWTAGCTF